LNVTVSKKKRNQYHSCMSLTKADLQAISKIVNEAIEDSKLHTAAGFAEVHEKFAEVHEKFGEVHNKFAEVHNKFGEVHEKLDHQTADLSDVKATVNRIENIQRAEVNRVDEQAKATASIKRKLKLA